MAIRPHTGLTLVLCVVVPAVAATCGGSHQDGDAPSGRIQSPDWSEATSPETAPDVEEAVRAANCTGSALDASLLARSGLCNTEGLAKPLPKSVVASLASTTATAVSGQVANVQIILRNTGTEPADLFLDHSCGFENVITKELRKAHSKRLDRVGGRDCPLDAACVGGVAHFTLLAGGQATITVPLAATVSVIGEQCDEMQGRALSPGKYTVEWATPYSQNALVLDFQVTELKRLAKNDCKAYARVVAQKAEPDIKLRREVEKQLLARCENEQPSRAFAECRMNAATELELANCQESVLPK